MESTTTTAEDLESELRQLDRAGLLQMEKAIASLHGECAVLQRSMLAWDQTRIADSLEAALWHLTAASMAVTLAIRHS